MKDKIMTKNKYGVDVSQISVEGDSVITFDYPEIRRIGLSDFIIGEDDIVLAASILTWNAHGNSVAAGWWHDKEDNLLPTDHSQKICLIHSEVSEAFEGVRKDAMDDHLPHRKAVEVELADAIIRIFDYAGKEGLDIGGAIAEKLLYNQVRMDHKREVRDAAGGKKF